MPKKQLIDLRSLIKQAGGTNRVAREFNLTSSAVSQWLRKGTLPDSEAAGKTNYSARLIEMAGLKLDEWDVRLIGRR